MILSGTTSGAAVSISGGSISGGGVGAGTLSLSSGSTINLGGNVGTIAGQSHGSFTYTNASSLIVDTVGFTGLTSNGGTITLAATGSITLNQNVNAGGATANLTASTSIGGSATVIGDIVKLTASGGDIGANGAPVHTTSTSNLILSGSNIYVSETNALANTSTRLAVSMPINDTLDLTAQSFIIDQPLGGTDVIKLTSTNGNITTTGSGEVIGTSITLTANAPLSAPAGIGTSASLPLVLAAPTGVPTLLLTANNAGIFVRSPNAIDLGVATPATDTANQTVSLEAPSFTTSAPFSAGR